MPNYSGYWEQDVIVDDTRKSKGETCYFYEQNSNLDDAYQTAIGYLIKRQDLLGRGYDADGNLVNAAAPGTPGLYALRLHDARNKRLGRTWIFDRGSYLSRVPLTITATDDEKSYELPGDPVFNTLHTRLYGSAVGAGANGEDLFDDRPFQIHGVPDGLTLNGRRATTGTSSVKFNQAWQALRSYMLNNNYGMMMQSQITPNHKRDVVKAEFDGDGKAILTLAAATDGITGIADGDRIRVTAANAARWNGEYYVMVHGDVANNQLHLLSGPPAGTPLLTSATLQRLRSGAGTPTKIFAPFYKGEIIRVSNTRANGPFVQSASRRKSRKTRIPKWLSELVGSLST